MKRTILTTLAVSMFAANTNAQTDTLVVHQPKEVKVITTADTLNINIEGSKENPFYYFNKTIVVNPEKEEVTKTSKNIGSGLGWDFSILEGRNSTPEIALSLRAQMYVGWNLMLNKPSVMKQNWLKSYEGGLDIFHLAVYPRSNKWWLSVDWGIVLSQYCFKENMMTTAPDGKIIMAPYPNGSSSRSSSFRTLASSLTFMGQYCLAKDHSIGLGIVWNSKVTDNCSYKTKYSLSDGTSITDMNELPIRSNLLSFKAEYMFTDKVGMYLRYTPMSIFKKDKAPQFSELSIGLQVRF